MCHLKQPTWKESPNGKISKSDITIAKNYLSETELKNLNNIVNIFLDIVENEYEKYKVIQDEKFLSDFDILMLEAKTINSPIIKD